MKLRASNLGMFTAKIKGSAGMILCLDILINNILTTVQVILCDKHFKLDFLTHFFVNNFINTRNRVRKHNFKSRCFFQQNSYLQK